jgi:hypothetical protein
VDRGRWRRWCPTDRRAKKAEDDAAAAKTQAKADLEQAVNDVQASTEAEAAKMHSAAQQASANVQESWNDV